MNIEEAIARHVFSLSEQAAAETEHLAASAMILQDYDHLDRLILIDDRGAVAGVPIRWAVASWIGPLEDLP